MNIVINGNNVNFEEPTWGDIQEYLSEMSLLIEGKKQKIAGDKLRLSFMCKLSDGIVKEDSLSNLKSSDISKLLNGFESLFDYENKKKE